MKTEIAAGFTAGLLAAALIVAHGRERWMPPAETPPPASQPPAAAIPDVPVLDQDGKRVNFYSDLVRGRTVAIDFVYTTCQTFCLPLSANFRMVQEELGARIGRDIDLISISLDPVADTPVKLKSFAAQFDARPGWTFVTGARPDIAMLLDRLGQPLGDPAEHNPLVLIRNDKSSGWTHVDGTDPKAIREALVAAAGPPAAPRAAADVGGAEAPAAFHAADATRRYMQNPLLRTQDDKPVHFFDDLLRGKVVMINFVFTTCQQTCSMVTANLARVQDMLGDKVGRSINMISLSVDPLQDRPAALKKFADNFGVKPGWYFLTGEPGEIDPLLHRLAGYSENPLDHSTILIIGNVDAGVWTKTLATAEAGEIARAVLAMQSPAMP